MADIKISELNALASTAIDVSADVFAVVDTSATETKKLSVENVLAPIVINKASAIITNLGTVTTADINGGTWQGTIDGAWTASGVTCANLGTVSAATSITSTAFVGDITGDVTGTAAVATAVTVADESSDTTCFPLFATAATGDLPPKSGSNLTFNSSSGLLTSTLFAGALTGNVTGNVTGTVLTAAQTNITTLGTILTFASTGIDDNSTTNAMTIDSTEQTTFTRAGASDDNKATVKIEPTGTYGIGLQVYSNADNDSNSLVEIHADNNSFDMPALRVIQDGTGDACWLGEGGGNVGIGTTSPGQALSVDGAVQVVGDRASQTGSYGIMDYYSGTTRFYSLGVDASTRGSFSWNIRESDEGNDITALTISSAGLTTFGDDVFVPEGKGYRFGDDKSGIFGNGDDGNTDNNYIKFITADSERMRVSPSGNIGIGDTDPDEAKVSIDNIETGDVALKINTTQPVNGCVLDAYSTGNQSCVRVTSTSSSPDHMFYVNTYAASGTGYDFWFNISDIDSSQVQQFQLRGDGTGQSNVAWTDNSLDYAEYFESTDGSVIPAGTTVVLEGDKVKASSEGETPIGVVRPEGTASSHGSMWNHWVGRHLKDDYGAFIMEEYTLTEWTEVSGEVVQYKTDFIPSDVVVPSDAKVISEDENGKLMRRKVNPDFDDSLIDEYESRETRDEWHVIGLLGQIPITKGQPVADSWIKMKDVSDTVEMYFVK